MTMPVLRFHDYRTEFISQPISVICTVNPNYTVLPDVFYYIDLESVEAGRLLYKQVVKKNEAPSRAQRLVKTGDILFQTVRPYQMNNYYHKEKYDLPVVASTGYALLRVDDNTDSRYLFQYIHTVKFVRLVLEKCTGTSFPAINSNDFSEIHITLPCLPEQKKIADFLSAVDEKIENQQAIVVSLEKQKKGFMQKIFSREIRFRDEDGGEYPEWEEILLKDVADIYDGTHQTPDYVDSGIRFLSVENISDINNSRKYITVEAFNNEFKIKPQINDILMTRIGDIGTPAIIETDDSYAYYVSLALIKCREIVPMYLYQYIKCRNFQLELWQRTLHIAFPQKINKGEIGECQIYVPSSCEQQLIADFFNTYDVKIDKERKIHSHWQNIKKGLLQQMFV